jgi:hypothetical protein
MFISEVENPRKNNTAHSQRWIAIKLCSLKNYTFLSNARLATAHSTMD